VGVIAAIYNFPTHRRGDTFTDKNIKFNFDITGADILVQFRTNTKGSAVFEWRTGVNITVLDATNGEIVLNQTVLNPPAQRYYYDLQITFANGVRFTYLTGQMLITQDISM